MDNQTQQVSKQKDMTVTELIEMILKKVEESGQPGGLIRVHAQDSIVTLAVQIASIEPREGYEDEFKKIANEIADETVH